MVLLVEISTDFSNFGSLKSTETGASAARQRGKRLNFSNFGSLKSTETPDDIIHATIRLDFSNFGSLKSTETPGLITTFDPDKKYFSNFGSLKSTETENINERLAGVDVISAISAR